MSNILKHRRGTTTQHSTFTGAQSEITHDTTKNTLVVHDGATAGGIPLARADSVIAPTISSATAVAGAGISITAVTTTGAATHTVTNTGVTTATAVAGTGISITAVTTTGAATHTVTNTGVTSVTAGTGISVSGSTGGVTITNTSPGTTYSGGNGISVAGSSIAVACPTAFSVGSYAYGSASVAGSTITAGSNYSAGFGNNQIHLDLYSGQFNSIGTNGSISGTWKWMTLGMSDNGNSSVVSGVVCRVA